jgi:uncharacterized damage-inducible protein DinB
MRGLPDRSEAAPYYFRYIDRVAGDDVVEVLRNQAEEIPRFLSGISEESSRRRYAGEKWTIRQVLNHVNDTERVFVFRALWFARGFESPLPSYEQEPAAVAAKANEVPWADHLSEFGAVRQATLAFFRSLPEESWSRRGIASDNPFTVRALAFVIAGHAAHHMAVLREKYL